MVTCTRVLALLSDYVDNDLDTEARLEVEQHLHECRACLTFADDLRRNIELCRGYEPGVRPRPLTASATAELRKAWREAIADRQVGSNRGVS
jgi:anti-sigma factor RsiW